MERFGAYLACTVFGICTATVVLVVCPFLALQFFDVGHDFRC